MAGCHRLASLFEAERPSNDSVGTLAPRFLFDLVDSIESQARRDILAFVGRTCQSSLVRLINLDPGNAGWQRDLSVSYNKIGDVLVAQANLPDALKAFRDGLAIRERLARGDPGNAIGSAI